MKQTRIWDQTKKHRKCLKNLRVYIPVEHTHTHTHCRGLCWLLLCVPVAAAHFFYAQTDKATQTEADSHQSLTHNHVVGRRTLRNTHTHTHMLRVGGFPRNTWGQGGGGTVHQLISLVKYLTFTFSTFLPLLDSLLLTSLLPCCRLFCLLLCFLSPSSCCYLPPHFIFLHLISFSTSLPPAHSFSYFLPPFLLTSYSLLAAFFTLSFPPPPLLSLFSSSFFLVFSFNMFSLHPYILPTFFLPHMASFSLLLFPFPPLLAPPPPPSIFSPAVVLWCFLSRLLHFPSYLILPHPSLHPCFLLPLFPDSFTICLILIT